MVEAYLHQDFAKYLAMPPTSDIQQQDTEAQAPFAPPVMEMEHDQQQPDFYCDALAALLGDVGIPQMPVCEPISPVPAQPLEPVTEERDILQQEIIQLREAVEGYRKNVQEMTSLYLQLKTLQTRTLEATRRQQQEFQGFRQDFQVLNAQLEHLIETKRKHKKAKKELQGEREIRIPIYLKQFDAPAMKDASTETAQAVRRAKAKSKAT